MGSIACLTRDINGMRGSTAPVPASLWGASGPQIRAIDTQIAAIIAAHTAAQERNYDGLQSIRNGFISAQAGTQSSLKALAQSELIAIVNADTPLPDLSVATAMRELVRQMRASSDTVLRCAVAKTVTAGSGNIGNATVICSVTGRYGVPQEYSLAETLVATCTGDQLGNGTGATKGSEPITIVAPAAEANKFNVNWPDGSGASAAINVIDPNIDANATGNLLTNSNFEVWTAVANTPDNWSILVGVAGTDIKKHVTTTYGGSSTACLQFVGDGSVLSSIVQPFDAVAGAGTTAELKPATQYGFNVWLYAAATMVAGVLKADLVDSTNTVINDDAAVANTLTYDLTTLAGTTWTNFSGFFRTPTNMPTTVKLRLRISTAMTNTRTLNVDFGAMALSTQLYVGGPYVNAFRASTDLVYGDTWNIAITNNRAGIFQTFFEQTFDMTSLGMILPSASAGNTIDDALVA